MQVAPQSGPEATQISSHKKYSKNEDNNKHVTQKIDVPTPSEVRRGGVVLYVTACVCIFGADFLFDCTEGHTIILPPCFIILPGRTFFPAALPPAVLRAAGGSARRLQPS